MPFVKCSVDGCSRRLQPILKVDPRDRDTWFYPECDVCLLSGALAKHIRETRLESARELVTLKQNVQANQEKAEFAQRRLSELSSGVARTERDAVIVRSHIERVRRARRLAPYRDPQPVCAVARD